jgi:radical SAM superfamily enzyme YgiQ (UPF0313 family)
MGLAWPLAFLERAGFHPRAIDLAVEPLDEAAVRQARLVAFSVPMHTALRLAVRASARVRALNPSAHICFHGLYAPLHRDHLLEAHGDSVLGGEVEAELVALAEKLEQASSQVERVPARIEHVPEVTLERLDFPVPQRHGLPLLNRYARLVIGEDSHTAGYVEASRGCKHLCRHCPIPSLYRGRFFAVPEEIVLADAARQVAAGARHLTFGDPDFLNGPAHALRVTRALHARHPELTFDVTVKIEHIVKERALWPELGRLGCLFVVSAVESLSPLVLEKLDKGHSRADVEAALDILGDAGIALRPSLVPFTPWTTLDDYLTILGWIEERRLIEHVDPVQLSIRLLIPPRSRLLELDEVRRLVGPLIAARLTHPWEHADPRLDELQKQVYAAAELGAANREPSSVTFERIRGLAHALAGGKLPVPVADVRSGPRGRAPHLSESWFC